MLPKNLQIRIEESPPPRPEPEVPAEPLDGVIESIMVAKSWRRRVRASKISSNSKNLRKLGDPHHVPHLHPRARNPN